MLETLGYVAAVLVGLSLGLLGAGGSILVVPILVYLMGMPYSEATGQSLFVVGTVALSGSVAYHRRGLVHWAAAISFLPPAGLGTYASQAVLNPALPDRLFRLGASEVSKETALAVLFALLLCCASHRMIFGSH